MIRLSSGMGGVSWSRLEVCDRADGVVVQGSSDDLSLPRVWNHRDETISSREGKIVVMKVGKKGTAAI